MNRSMWLIGTFRNSIVVIVSSYVSYLYINSIGHDIKYEGDPPIPFKVVGMSIHLLNILLISTLSNNMN